MKNEFIKMLLCVMVLHGCNASEDKKVTDETNIKTEAVTDSLPPKEEHQHDSIGEIELNNGAKWKVADHMLGFIRLMETDVKKFAKVQNPILKDYILLGENLQKNIDSLTSNCTMTGKAHDELHKWLLPYIDLVDELNKAKNEQDAAKVYADLQASYITFNAFFE